MYFMCMVENRNALAIDAPFASEEIIEFAEEVADGLEVDAWVVGDKLNGIGIRFESPLEAPKEQVRFARYSMKDAGFRVVMETDTTLFFKPTEDCDLERAG